MPKKSNFITDSEVPDGHFFDTFGNGVNRKISKSNLFSQIKKEAQTYYYDSEDDLKAADLEADVDNPIYVRVAPAWRLYRITSLSPVAPYDFALNNGATATLDRLENLQFINVQDMKDAPYLKEGDLVEFVGYNTPGDGGGNKCEIGTGFGTADNGSVFDLPGSGLQAKGLFPGGRIYAQQFGFPSDADAIGPAIAFAKSKGSRVLLNADTTILVPSHATVPDDAFRYTSVESASSKISVTVNIESGTIINSAFSIEGGDYGNYTLTSDDAEVIADAENIGDFTIFSSPGAFAVVLNAVGPTWDILVDCQNSGPEDIKGITVRGPSSSLIINSGKGIKNVGLRSNLGGAEPAQYGYGLFVWNGANVLANSAVVSGSAGRNLWISRSSKITGAGMDLTGSQGQAGTDPQDSANHGAVYCTRASWANLEFSDFSNSANRGLTCTRGYANAEGGIFDNITGATIVPERGARINAYGATGAGGAPLDKSELGGAVGNFNFLTGAGIVFEQTNNPPSVDSFTNEASNGNYLALPSGDMTCYRSQSNPLTLVHVLDTELRATWTFPKEFRDVEYSLDLTLVSETFAASKRGQWQAKFSSRTTTTVDVVLQSDGLWTAGETADVMVKAIGKQF